MANRLQVNVMLNVTAFRVFRAKKFPTRRQIIEKRAHLDLRSRRFTTIAHHLDLTPINDDLRSGDGIRLACGQSKTGNTGDARQCFAAKSKRADSLQVSSRANLARSMPFKRKKRVITIHAAAIVNDTDHGNSSPTNHDLNLAGVGVDAVLDEFFHHRGGTLHYFASRNLAGDRVW